MSRKCQSCTANTYVGHLRVNNNLPATFDQNAPNTLDKIVAKHIPTKNLDLEPKCQCYLKHSKILT